MAEEILEIADDGSQDTEEIEISEGVTSTRTNAEVIQRSRLRVDTRKWLMSKLAPKKYGDKLGLEHSGEVNVSLADRISKARKRHES